MIDFYARRCRSCSRRAAVRQRCFRLARRALRAHRFGGCSPAHRGDALLSTRSDARRSTTGTTARLRLLGRELARAQQLPPPRPPRAQTAATAIFVRQSDAECFFGVNQAILTTCKWVKTQHWRPGDIVRDLLRQNEEEEEDRGNSLKHKQARGQAS